jgi:L-threonylcarbamoyladenylate synthase
MNTEIVVVDPADPDPRSIERAAEFLRAGRLVAFPTETVYGLGASALDPAAVRDIFRAKGRPASNPLIVHVPDPARVASVAAEWPAAAARLAGRFWPGPLTIVVPKRPEVPDEVTAGGPTVAVRCPDHAVARALLRAAGVPLAAPSANRSTELSPTRAGHVVKGLGGLIDMILDGGPCPGGIESTVVDVTGPVVRLLRPGLVTVPMLEKVVGPVEVATRTDGVARSPGRMEKHYSPRTPMRLVDGLDIVDDFLEAVNTGKRIGLLQLFGPEAMPNEPVAYAAELYSRLHDMDERGFDFILVELPPDTPEWAAIRDRLTRAAARS